MDRVCCLLWGRGHRFCLATHFADHFSLPSLAMKRTPCILWRTVMERISLFHRAFQFTTSNGPTNALVCNKTFQMSYIKTLKIAPTCFDHQLIIIRELFDRGYNHWLKFEPSSMVMRQHTFIRFASFIVWRGMSTVFRLG
jgi:hypothetical protein